MSQKIYNENEKKKEEGQGIKNTLHQKTISHLFPNLWQAVREFCQWDHRRDLQKTFFSLFFVNVEFI